jgi:hypothetical protein
VVVVRSAFGEKQTAQAGDCHEFAVSSRKNVDVAGCSRVDDADKVGDSRGHVCLLLSVYFKPFERSYANRLTGTG